MRRKKKEVVLDIIDNTFLATGVAKEDDKTFHVKRAFKGQKVRGLLKSYKKGVGVVNLFEVLERAPYEVDAKCEHHGRCGGCLTQTIPLAKQREFKEEEILKLFKSKGIEYNNYLGISGVDKQYNYRNKMEFSFGDPYKHGPLNLGMHERNMGKNIINTTNCELVSDDIQLIHKATIDYFREQNLSYYHIVKREGYLRHLVVRESLYNKEIMVNIVTTSQIEFDLNDYKDLLLTLELDSEITSIIHTVNDSFSDSVTATDVTVLYGKDYITEHVLGLKFKISPFSFFQTNTDAAIHLYSRVKQRIQDKYDTIWDLFCGTGTISQIVSDSAKKVIGVEIVEEAVVKARENAKLNGIDNITFIASDVKDVIKDIEEKPDLVIVDPPRMGIHPKAMKHLLNLDPKEILYVSCNPKTLANDLAIFKEHGYTFDNLELVDMFANTPHTECIIEIRKINSNIE